MSQNKSLSLRPMAMLLAVIFPVSAYASGVSVDGGEPISEAFSIPNWGLATPRAASDGLGHFGSSVLASVGPSDPPHSSRSEVNVAFVDTIVNSTGASQAVNFDFSISSLLFSMKTGWMGDVKATFDAKIFVNGSAIAVWDSSASFLTGINYSAGRITPEILPTVVVGGSTPLSFISSPNGFIDSSYGYGYNYSLAAPYSNTISLGNLAAGDSLSVRYEVDITAYSYSYGGSASVVFDDPSALELGSSATPVAKLEFAQAVPEPEVFSMMAAGLGLLVVASRRQKRRAG